MALSISICVWKLWFNALFRQLYTPTCPGSLTRWLIIFRGFQIIFKALKLHQFKKKMSLFALIAYCKDVVGDSLKIRFSDTCLRVAGDIWILLPSLNIMRWFNDRQLDYSGVYIFKTWPLQDAATTQDVTLLSRLCKTSPTHTNSGTDVITTIQKTRIRM